MTAPIAHDQSPLEHVSQLTHIAGPFVTAQRLHRLWRQFRRGASELAEKARGERQNVVTPLAERRNANVEDVQAVVEILTEVPLARPPHPDCDWWRR